ncbi:hypothetical protein TrLO_g9843 [Triparma laevis f. longispina]|uniref:quinolinate synthase n=1 Tax=Triparma laevis f. longispina TaxID=1714387 RepID=A0A9W7FNF8_9STRA|nr:hypothetical protein TrLO_g9843 [Triparma laevis f. longispina]
MLSRLATSTLSRLALTVPRTPLSRSLISLSVRTSSTLPPSSHRNLSSASAAPHYHDFPEPIGFEVVSPRPVESSNAFPSILITGDEELIAKGSFAEAQKAFIDPDPQAVSSLSEGMEAANVGIVAHFYMDVELQSVLQAVPNQKRVKISDSLVMGDAAVSMCRDGASAICVLGVDFMSESVKAIMTKNGYGHIPVYRADERKIGCSLAESAENLSYGAWLTKASQEKDTNPLHVIYINTSLETKALSTNIVPTVTCTSSNVLQTMLQSSLQIPELSIWYGPDTCMGYNLQTMFEKVLKHWSDEEIKQKLHQEHDRKSIQKLLNNLHVYPSGNCVVHHMFGKECVETVQSQYPDAFVSAHLEVPGEMFEIAMEASLDDKGVVGSTSDILNFITKKVEEAAVEIQKTGQVGGEKKNLQFILGTEAGMVTSIVSNVKRVLASNPAAKDFVTCEIIFPVASDAVMVDSESEFGISPGVSGGEGCSTAGGCATCPFMKMNELDKVVDICQAIADGKSESLTGLHPPKRLEGKFINGRPAVEVGVDSILHMRHLMSEGKFSEDLVKEVVERSAANAN